MLRNKSPLFQNFCFSFVGYVLVGPSSYAKNKVEKKRKIAAFITKKKVQNNCLRKAVVLKKSKKIIEWD